VDLLSNRVLEPFFARIDREITNECLEAQGQQWRRERVSIFYAGWSEWLEVEEDRCEGREEV
jgi:hypothetical protein